MFVSNLENINYIRNAFFLFSINLIKNKYFYYCELFFLSQKAYKLTFHIPHHSTIYVDLLLIYNLFTIEVGKRYRIIHNFETQIAL